MLRTLMWLNAAGAVLCFGLVLYWIAFGYLGQALAWIIQVLALGGFLSLVAMAGGRLGKVPDSR